jgi:dTDP-glucose 4,6-dehydratase
MMRSTDSSSPVLLVTGGAGFIGTNFVLGTVRSGAARVVTLDVLTYSGNRGNLAGLDDAAHRFVQGDVCDRALVESLLREHHVDAVVHFAAESHVDRSIDGPDAFVRTNVTGTFELLEAARAYVSTLDGTRRARFRFLHVSTDEVFGSLGEGGTFREETPYAPNSPYSATKAASDHLVRAYHHTYGLPTITTNCSNNFGPYQFPEKLIPLMVLNAIEGKPLPVYGTGKNVRDWLHVDDHCDGIRAALARGIPGSTYLFGGRTEKTNLEIVHLVCDLVDELAPRAGHRARELVKFVQDRPGHDLRYAVDPSRAERELGWSRRASFEQALRSTVRWYVENTAWCGEITSRRYARERLGLQAAAEGSR